MSRRCRKRLNGSSKSLELWEGRLLLNPWWEGPSHCRKNGGTGPSKPPQMGSDSPGVSVQGLSCCLLASPLHWTCQGWNPDPSSCQSGQWSPTDKRKAVQSKSINARKRRSGNQTKAHAACSEDVRAQIHTPGEGSCDSQTLTPWESGSLRRYRVRILPLL